MRALLRSHPNACALTFGLLLCLLVLAAAEGAARLALALRPTAPGPGDWHYEYDGSPLSQPHPRYGFAPTPNTQVAVARRRDGETAYSVTWTTDAQGRRVTPVETPGDRTQAALFFGCSFTFGEGVEDTENLPARFAAHAPGYLPYNYGFMGYGPQHAFLQLDDPAAFADIAAPVTLVVYTVIPHQIDRLIGRMRLSTGWGKSLPYLREEHGKFVYAGPFETGRGARQTLYTWLARSALLKYLRIDLPRRIAAPHYARTARVLAASAEKARQQFPRARCLVLLYPRQQGTGPLAEMLAREGVEVVDLAATLPEGFATAPEFNLPDQHPSPAAYEALARALAQWLETHPAPA